jgi:hypothetical protein
VDGTWKIRDQIGIQTRAPVAMNRQDNIDSVRMRDLAPAERTVFADAATYRKLIDSKSSPTYPS